MEGEILLVSMKLSVWLWLGIIGQFVIDVVLLLIIIKICSKIRLWDE